MNKHVAIVTGASSGIGLAIARTLLERGLSVVAVSRTASRSGRLEPSPRLAVLDGDVGQAGTAERAVAEARARFGRLDLLVNNAGIFIAKPFVDFTADEIARVVSTNLAGFFHMTQHALRAMVPAGGGHVVNIGTSLVRQPLAAVPGAVGIATKGAIEAATRALAIEHAPHGIRVNTLAVGIIDTPMHSPANHDFLATLSPARRIGTAEEVAEAVVYLHGAGYVSGEILHVDGGAHAGKWS